MTRRAALFMVLSVISLTVLGFVMQMSTGGAARGGKSDPSAALRMQTLAFIVGAAACAGLSFLDYRHLKRLAMPLFWLGIVLLVLCWAPGIGIKAMGARRWIGAGGFTFQSSEAARISSILLLAAWCAWRRDKRRTFWHGFLAPLLILALPVALIGAEVDLGAAALLFSAGLIVMVAAGMRWIYGLSTVLGGAAALAIMVYAIPNRMARVNAFLHLEDKEFAIKFPDAAELNHQQIQAQRAFGSGGAEGLGLGEGRSKMRYLPLCQTDFIFPVVGEELGLTGSLLVVAAFLVFAMCGLLIASHAPDRFGKLLGTGLVCLITIQALINIGVTTACLPNKGMPMPFVSNGGSNLACSLAAVGILLSIFRRGRVTQRLAVLNKDKLTPRV